MAGEVNLGHENFLLKPVEDLELSQKPTSDQWYERCSKWSMLKRNVTTPQSMMSQPHRSYRILPSDVQLV